MIVPAKTASLIAPAELEDRLARSEPLVVVDVRTYAEHSMESLTNARCVPLDDLDARADELGASSALVCVCATGHRALEAAKRLEDVVECEVLVLDGGLARWRREGRPTRRAPPAFGGSLLRYERQLRLPEVGLDGQARLAEARVLVVGAGGLGSPVAIQLALAGVGTLAIADDDRVALSNLHRQPLHGESSVGESKVTSAARTLARLNSTVTVVPLDVRATPETSPSLVAGFDVVVDGTDNVAARYALSDACVAHGVPLVHAAVARFEGQLTTFVPARAAARLGLEGGPCYRCLFPEAPSAELVPSCGEAGVLGVVPALLGTLQAGEVLKLLLGYGAPLVGRLALVDAETTTIRTVAYGRDPRCPCTNAG